MSSPFPPSASPVGEFRPWPDDELSEKRHHDERRSDDDECSPPPVEYDERPVEAVEVVEIESRLVAAPLQVPYGLAPAPAPARCSPLSPPPGACCIHSPPAPLGLAESLTAPDFVALNAKYAAMATRTAPPATTTAMMIVLLLSPALSLVSTALAELAPPDAPPPPPDAPDDDSAANEVTEKDETNVCASWPGRPCWV